MKGPLGDPHIYDWPCPRISSRWKRSVHVVAEQSSSSLLSIPNIDLSYNTLASPGSPLCNNGRLQWSHPRLHRSELPKPDDRIQCQHHHIRVRLQTPSIESQETLKLISPSRYTPSLAVGVLGVVLFVIGLAAHLFLLLRHRTWYFSTVVVGTAMEIVGYAFRILSSQQNPYSVIWFVVQV
jgi:hypothetical protein